MFGACGRCCGLAPASFAATKANTFTLCHISVIYKLKWMIYYLSKNLWTGWEALIVDENI